MTEHKDEVLATTLKMLLQVACQDGIITQEEANIIDRVKIDIDKYLSILERAKIDGKITLRESMELAEMKNTIIANAGTIAAKDYTLDMDEKKLLQKLVEILNTHID